MSIVVTAYNNEDSVGECLQSLRDQHYPKAEILVVLDDSSKDGTKEVVERLARDLRGLQLVRCSGVGRSEARNIGWRRARSEIVIFADGDDQFEKEYVSRAVSCLLDDSRIGGVCLGGAARARRNTILGRYHEAYGPTDERIERDSRKDPDWAFVYRKECLEKVGGFDQGLSQAEDRDLCSRVKNAGYRVGYVSGVNWYHRKPSSFTEFVAKEYTAGSRRVSYEIKNRKYTSVSGSLLPLAFILVALVLALSGKNLYLAFLLFAATSYGVFRTGRNGRHSGKISDASAFAFIALTGKIASSLGSLQGLLLLLLARLGILTGEFGRY